MRKNYSVSPRSTLLGALTALGLVIIPVSVVQLRAEAETRGFGANWENFVAGTKIVAVDRVNHTIKVTQPDAPIKISQSTHIRKFETSLGIEDLRVGDLISVGPTINTEGLKVSEISEAKDLKLMIGQKLVNEVGELVLEMPFLAFTREHQVDSIGKLRVYELANGTSYVDISVPASDAGRVSFTRYSPLGFADLAPGQMIAGKFYRSTNPARENDLGTEDIEVIVEKPKGLNGTVQRGLPE